MEAMVPLSQTNALDSHALACHRRAGRIAAQCRQWALSNIAPGVSIRWVLESIEEPERPTRSVLLPLTMSVRGSTAPPPA